MRKKGVLIWLSVIALGLACMGFTTTKGEVYAEENYTLTVRYVDTAGNELACEDKILTSSAYSLPIKQITGYTYSSSDRPIAGTISRDTVLTMIYEEIVYSVKVNFLDENGNKIKDTISYPATLHTYLIIDLRKVGVIDGYTFTGDNEVIAVGVVGGVSMDLIYRANDTKWQGGGCASHAGAEAAMIAACPLLLILRKWL